MNINNLAKKPFDAAHILSLKMYESFPRIPPKKNTGILVIRMVGRVVMQILIVPTIVEFIIMELFAEKIIRYTLTKDRARLSPIAKARLVEMEQRVQHIARNAGLAHPEKIRVFASDKHEASATGHTIIISTTDLVKPGDLPEEFSLEKLKSGQMTEEEWGIRLKVLWLPTFTGGNCHLSMGPSKLNIDVQVEELKTLAKRFKDQKRREKIQEAVIGHELGHCALSHASKKNWARLGWRLLCPVTFGITFLFEKRVMQSLSRRHEKQADMFAVQKVNGRDGLIDHFSLEQQRVLSEKYPEFLSKEGDYLNDKEHPPFTERIAYLKAASVA